MILFLVLSVLWYVIGVVALFWHWSGQFDVTGEDLFMILFSGLLGPIALIFLLENVVIFKRRGR